MLVHGVCRECTAVTESRRHGLPTDVRQRPLGSGYAEEATVTTPHQEIHGFGRSEHSGNQPGLAEPHRRQSVQRGLVYGNPKRTEAGSSERQAELPAADDAGVHAPACTLREQ